MRLKLGSVAFLAAAGSGCGIGLDDEGPPVNECRAVHRKNGPGRSGLR